jgi:hypothetical protein
MGFVSTPKTIEGSVEVVWSSPPPAGDQVGPGPAQKIALWEKRKRSDAALNTAVPEKDP